MLIEILNGKDITFTKVIKIKQIWADVFGDGIIKEEKKVPFTDEIIFMLSDKKEEILAVGCLYQINAKLLKKLYKIQGIGSIASVEKGKGYGKILMKEINNYLKKKKLTGIGFCAPTNTPFYKKCNFQIEHNNINRFINISGTGRQPPVDEDILYLEGNDLFMRTFLSHPKAKISIPHFW